MEHGAALRYLRVNGKCLNIKFNAAGGVLATSAIGGSALTLAADGSMV